MNCGVMAYTALLIGRDLDTLVPGDSGRRAAADALAPGSR